MEIRKIHPGEINDIMLLFQQYADEATSAMPEMADEIDYGALSNTVREWSIQHHMCFLAAFEGEHPIGFIGGGITKQPWSVKYSAHISLIFLSEKHRSMENFKSLVSKFEEWARIAQATKITAGDIGINIERSSKLYKYLGFTECLSVKRDIEYV